MTKRAQFIPRRIFVTAPFRFEEPCGEGYRAISLFGGIHPVSDSVADYAIENKKAVEVFPDPEQTAYAPAASIISA